MPGQFLLNRAGSFPGRQSGAATLLILSLLGISIGVAILSAVDMIRGTQAQTTTYHSQIQAQMNAWEGVRAVQQYIRGLQQSDTPPTTEELLQAFETAYEQQANILQGSDGVEAYVTRFNGDPAQFDLAISVHGISAPGSDRARAVSIVELVSRFTEGEVGTPPSSSPPPVLNLVGNLTINGNFEVISTTDAPVEITVSGYIESKGSSIRGVDIINATESIDFGGGSEFKVLRSNGDVRLTGSATVLEEIQARGNVCISGGAGSIGLTRANGFVYGDGGANFGDIQAKGQTIDESYIRLCESERATDKNGNLLVVNLAGNHTLGSVQAEGTVRNRGGSIESLLADGDLLNGYGSVASGAISGNAYYCNGNNIRNCRPVPGWKKQDINVNQDPNLTVSIPDVEEIKSELPVFDAYQFREYANYAFDTNDQGFPVVTVKHVENIPDGEYFLGSYDGPYKDRLCTELTGDSTPSNPMCAEPAAEASHFLCEGYSRWNRCFSYDSTIATWSITGNSLAQGIIWFEGNLSLGDGDYFNTFIATQNIVTGSTNLYAPNYAGYSGDNESPHGMCENAISPNNPSQLCQNGTYNPNWAQGAGNYTLMAGSVLDNGDYLGGNIVLGSNTTSYGSVLAGNEFGTSGQSTIYGYVSAYAAGEETDHAIGGQTTIILDALPPTYTPQGPIEEPTGDNGGGGEEGEPFGFELMWGRYQ